MTSLFSRLQKLNKDGTEPPWEMYRYESGEFGGMFNAPNAPHENSNRCREYAALHRHCGHCEPRTPS